MDDGCGPASARMPPNKVSGKAAEFLRYLVETQQDLLLKRDRKYQSSASCPIEIDAYCLRRLLLQAMESFFRCTRAPSLRAMIRKPSCFISCSTKAAAVVGVGALMGRHGWMKPTGRARGRVNIACKIVPLGLIA